MSDCKKIEAAIKRTLNLPVDHMLTDEERQRVTTLSLWGDQIVDLAPLARLTGLTTLDLWDNQIVGASVAELRAALPGCEIHAVSKALWRVQGADIRRNAGRISPSSALPPRAAFAPGAAH